MIEFKLNEKENELAEEFLQEHRHPEIYKGTIGGHMNFIFTPTSIGDACTIKCTICGAEKNITDYNNW
jgi:cupin superfamily acireductone dioxygenase involved in methionine salvage